VLRSHMGASQAAGTSSSRPTPSPSSRAFQIAVRRGRGAGRSWQGGRRLGSVGYRCFTVPGWSKTGRRTGKGRFPDPAEAGSAGKLEESRMRIVVTLRCLNREAKLAAAGSAFCAARPALVWRWPRLALKGNRW